MHAIAHYPGQVAALVSEFERIMEENGRITDLFTGYIDPDDSIPEPATPVVPASGSKPAQDKDDEEDDEDADDKDDSEAEEESTDNGPDPEEAKARIAAIAEQLAAVNKILAKNKRSSKAAVSALDELGQLFMPIKLVPKVFDEMVEQIRDHLQQIRQHERSIMQLCVRDAKMPRADFLKLFPGNETNQEWADKLAKGKAKYAESLAAFAPEIRRHQSLLAELEQTANLEIADI